MMGEDRLQRHIERVLGRDDTPEDWRALHDAASDAPTTWQRLLRDLEDDAEIRAAVRLRRPEHAVELPGRGPGAIVRQLLPGHGGSWAGWMVAACAVFLWLVEAPGPFGRPAAEPIEAQGVTASEGSQGLPLGGALAGAVEGDLPDLVLASEPAGDGSYDVVVLRREVVRRRMPLAETVHLDDSGQPFAVPVSHDTSKPTRSF